MFVISPATNSQKVFYKILFFFASLGNISLFVKQEKKEKIVINLNVHGNSGSIYRVISYGWTPVIYCKFE